MKTRLRIRAVAATFAALAAVGQSCAADAPAIRPFATVHEDVHPGEIRLLTASLESADNQGTLGIGMTVNVVTLQPSVIWAPQVSLCASSSAPERSECIRFWVGASESILSAEWSSTGGAGGFSKAALEPPLSLRTTDAFRVSIRVDKDRRLTFAVNGKDVGSRVLDFDAKDYSYGCSSMVCDLALASLRPRDPMTKIAALAQADADVLVKGNAAMDRGDLDEAIQDFSKFIEIAPSMSAAYALRAQARIAKGQPDLALPDLDEALKRDDTAERADEFNGLFLDYFYLGTARPYVERLRKEIRAKLAPPPCPKAVASDCA